MINVFNWPLTTALIYVGSRACSLQRLNGSTWNGLGKKSINGCPRMAHIVWGSVKSWFTRFFPRVFTTLLTPNPLCKYRSTSIVAMHSLGSSYSYKIRILLMECNHTFRRHSIGKLAITKAARFGKEDLFVAMTFFMLDPRIRWVRQSIFYTQPSPSFT